MKDEKIHIIGAGVSGLVAAIRLEEAGYAPVIYEKSDRVGGRVKTDYGDSAVFDQGFQVLLTRYPLAQKYLDYDLLRLQKFRAGSVIFWKGKKHILGDPLRDTALFPYTFLTSVASISDKLKILQLKNELQKKKVHEIFGSPEKETMEYLKERRFSDRVIQNFFVPFFGGIFLETKLETSSRMFEFVYKMFSEGDAAIPEKGMQVIPNQLAGRLKDTRIEFNTKVSRVETRKIILDNGTVRESDYTIVATEAAALIPNLKEDREWRSVENLYFKVENKVFKKKMIALIADNSLINNFHYVNSTSTKEGYLLSVTVIKEHNLDKKDLQVKISSQLREYCDIEATELIKYFKIEKALPVLNNVIDRVPLPETQLSENIFLAGDVLANGSLNAAMANGEAAANAVIAKIEQGFINC